MSDDDHPLGFDFDIPTLGREQKLLVLGVVGLVILSAVIAPSMLSSTPPAPETDAKSGSVSTPTASGYAEVPDSHVTTDGSTDSAGGPSSPDSSTDSGSSPGTSTHNNTTPSIPAPAVSTNVGSQTLTVHAYRRGGDLAIDLTDDTIHDGRWVRIPTAWYREVRGDVPEVAYVEHESGETYASSVRVDQASGTASFYVRGFSTNTVTFSGEVVINATPALDGSTYTYNLSGTDSTSKPNGTMTGVNATEWDNVTATNVSNGGSVSVNPAGDVIRGPNAGEPEVVLTGVGFNRTDSASATGTAPGTSTSIDVDGNLEPYGPATNNDPELSVTAHSQSKDHYGAKASDYLFIGDDNGYDLESEVRIDSPPDNINQVKFYVPSTTGTISNIVADIYIVKQGPDYSSGEGTLVKSGWSPSGGTGWKTITLNQTYDPGSASTITVEFDTTSAGSDVYARVNRDDSPTDYWYYDKGNGNYRKKYPAPQVQVRSVPFNVSVDADDGTSHSFGDMSDGQTSTVAYNLSSAASSLTFNHDGGTLDWSLDWRERAASEDPSVDYDGDGTADCSVAGLLTAGETKTCQLPNLGPSDDSASVSLTSGKVDVRFNLEELSKTKNPEVYLNGNLIGSYSGTLAAGSTTSFSASKSLLNNESNTVDVKVGDGTLSSDAPTPSVNLDYSHDATDKQSVQYSAEKWSERYNISHTWASARENAQLSIPFEGSVVAIRDVEKRVNGSTWQTVSASNYSLSNTTLTVDLGSVKTSEKVEVRANGSKVQVYNGSIQVLDPSGVGEVLASKVEVTSKQSGFYIAYAGISGQIYYTTNETWSSPNTYHLADAQGHKRLYAPKAPEGGTFYVKSIPVTADPKNNEVKIVSVGGSSSEPAFKVAHGAIVGTTVNYTFQDATADTTYELYSRTHDIVRDSGTAQSPLTLTDDDSNETLAFLVDDGSSGGSSDSSAGSIVVMPQAGDGNARWLPLMGVALALAGIVVVSRQPEAVSDAAQNTGDALESLLAAIPVVGPALGSGAQSGVAGLGGVLESVVGNRIAAMAVGGAIIIGAIQGGIVVLPQGSLVIVMVAGVALVSLVVLRELGEFSMQRWVTAVVATGVVAIEVVSPSQASLTEAVVGSRIFPLLAIGGLYLAYRAIQGIRQPDEVNKVVIAGETQSGQGGDAD